MSIEQGLFQLIQSDAGVASLVDTTQGKGVYWVQGPKETFYPIIVLSRVATTDTYTFQGDAGFRDALFQIDCYGSSYYESRCVADIVRKLVGSFMGNLPDLAATAVGAVFTTKDWDMPYEEGAVGFVYRAMLEFRVWYYDNALPLTPSSGTEPVISGGTF
jgi:hypothetical protein